MVRDARGDRAGPECMKIGLLEVSFPGFFFDMSNVGGDK
jgi:hypothetical protein